MPKAKAKCRKCGASLKAESDSCPSCSKVSVPEATGTETTQIFTDGSQPVSKREFHSERIPLDMPKKISVHTMVREIGRGGTGVVYLAREEGWGREIALKIALPNLENRLRMRFLQEAHITGRLQHPAIVPVYRVGKTNDGRDFYTMKRVQGRTLSDVIKGLRNRSGMDTERYNLRRRAALMLAVCEGVAYAHDNGVIHRDLKPGNIMVGDYGEVYILDWGLAKMLFGRPQDTWTQEGDWSAPSPDDSQRQITDPTETAVIPAGRVLVSGTPAYMSPEQARGENKTTDRRSDVWSLGAVLFQLLTLHSPVQGTDAQETLRNAASGKCLRLDDLPEGRAVPGELAVIVDRSLQRSPEKRYQNANEMAGDLRAFLEGEGRWRQVYQFYPGNMDAWNKDWTISTGKFANKDFGLHPVDPGGSGTVGILNIPISGDVRVELVGRCRQPDPNTDEPEGELSLFLSAPEPSQKSHVTAGYCFQFGADFNSSAKLAKNDIDVAVRTGVRWIPDTRHTIVAERVGNRLRMEVDGNEIFTFLDLFPLSGDRVGIYGFGPGGVIEEFRVYSRGQDVTVSCLSIPDQSFSYERYEEALQGYSRIASDLAGREEGWLARYKAGLCHLARTRIIDAREEFDKLEGTPGELLAHLGRALLAEAEMDWKMELVHLNTAIRVGAGSPLRSYILAHMWTRATQLHRRKQQEPAIAFYQTILRTDPHGGRRVVHAQRRICQDLFDLGRDDEALHYLEQLGLDSPRDRPSVLTETLEYLIQSERWDDAMAAALALKETPSARHIAYSFLARNFIYRRLWEVAERYIGDGLEEFKNEKTISQINRLNIWVPILRGNFDNAKEILSKPPFSTSKKLNNEVPETFLWTCWLAALTGDQKMLGDTLQDAEKENNPKILQSLAAHVQSRIAFLKNDIKAARMFWDKATKIVKGAPTSLLTFHQYPFSDRITFGNPIIHAHEEDKTSIPDKLNQARYRGHGRFARTITHTLSNALLDWDGSYPPPEPPDPGLDCPGYSRAMYFLALAEYAEGLKGIEAADKIYRRVLVEALSPYDFSAWAATLRLKANGAKLPSGTPDFSL